MKRRVLISIYMLLIALNAVNGYSLTFNCEEIHRLCSETDFDSDYYKIGRFGTCVHFDEHLQSLVIECLKYNAMVDAGKIDKKACGNDSLFNRFIKKYAKDMKWFSMFWSEYSGLRTHYTIHYAPNGTPKNDIKLLKWIEKNRQKISPEYYVWYIDYSKYFYRSCARCRSIEELDSLEPEFKQRYKQLIDTIRRQTGLKTRKKLFAM